MSYFEDIEKYSGDLSAQRDNYQSLIGRTKERLSQENQEKFNEITQRFEMIGGAISAAGMGGHAFAKNISGIKDLGSIDEQIAKLQGDVTGQGFEDFSGREKIDPRNYGPIDKKAVVGPGTADGAEISNPAFEAGDFGSDPAITNPGKLPIKAEAGALPTDAKIADQTIRGAARDGLGKLKSRIQGGAQAELQKRYDALRTQVKGEASKVSDDFTRRGNKLVGAGDRVKQDDIFNMPKAPKAKARIYEGANKFEPIKKTMVKGGRREASAAEQMARNPELDGGGQMIHNNPAKGMTMEFQKDRMPFEKPSTVGVHGPNAIQLDEVKTKGANLKSTPGGVDTGRVKPQFDSQTGKRIDDFDNTAQEDINEQIKAGRRQAIGKSEQQGVAQSNSFFDEIETKGLTNQAQTRNLGTDSNIATTTTQGPEAQQLLDDNLEDLAGRMNAKAQGVEFEGDFPPAPDLPNTIPKGPNANDGSLNPGDGRISVAEAEGENKPLGFGEAQDGGMPGGQKMGPSQADIGGNVDSQGVYKQKFSKAARADADASGEMPDPMGKGPAQQVGDPQAQQRGLARGRQYKNVNINKPQQDAGQAGGRVGGNEPAAPIAESDVKFSNSKGLLGEGEDILQSAESAEMGAAKSAAQSERVGEALGAFDEIAVAGEGAEAAAAAGGAMEMASGAGEVIGAGLLVAGVLHDVLQKPASVVTNAGGATGKIGFDPSSIGGNMSGSSSGIA